jgi:hypothetical protein
VADRLYRPLTSKAISGRPRSEAPAFADLTAKSHLFLNSHAQYGVSAEERDLNRSGSPWQQRFDTGIVMISQFRTTQTI